MIVLPGRRFGVASMASLPRLLRALAVVFSGDVDYMIEMAHAHDWERHREFAGRWSRRVLDATHTRLDVVGMEYVDSEESYVVASFHESFADALALMQLPLHLVWAARDELTGWHRLDEFLDTPAAFTLNPEAPVSAMRTLLREAPEVFGTGRSLVVFPQGTLVGIEAAFSVGAFRIADRFRRPLLPVVITGSHRVYDYPFSPMVRFGQTIRMEILPPIPAGQAVEAMDEVERLMSETALSAVPGPRRYRPEHDGFWDGYAFEISPEFEDLASQVAAHRRSGVEADAANSAKPSR